MVWRSVRTARTASPAFRDRVHRVSRLSGLWWLVLAIVWLLSIPIGIVVGAWFVHQRLWDMPPDTWRDVADDLVSGEYVPYTVVWCGTVVVTTLAVIGLAFGWQRHCVVRVLRYRDLCPQCKHGLAGLPVQPNAWVVCPECAGNAPIAVDWGEASDSGSGSFAPAVGVVRVFWTRHRVKQVGLACVAMAVVVGVVFATWWGVREVRIRREAEVAAGDRVPPDRVEEALRGVSGFSLAGKGEVDPASAEDVLSAAYTKYSDFYDQYVNDHKGTYENPDYCDPSPMAVYDAHGGEKYELENQRLATLLMADLERNGVFQLLETLPEHPSLAPAYSPMDAGGPPPAPGLGNMRKLSRACVARAVLAMDAGDLPTFNQSVRLCFRLSRWTSSGGTLLHYLVSTAIDANALYAMERALDSQAGPEWMDAIASLVSEF